ncbi:MAG: ABC transporter ATP-binding protein [bacterium]
MLKVENLQVYYGGIHALKGISLEVNQGEIVTLIGANGAGKSTTLRTISGLLHAKEGKVVFKGEEINNIPAHHIVARGLCHVPEGRKIFSELSVRDNLEMGAYLRKDKNGIKEDMERVFNLFPRLYERQKQMGGTLSGGEQQMLAIGRAILSKPELLLMDEPSMGLAPLLVQEIFEIIKRINKEGTTILLIEQNANMALSIADRAYVMETGNIVLQGSAKDISNNQDVRKAYLGE